MFLSHGIDTQRKYPVISLTAASFASAAMALLNKRYDDPAFDLQVFCQRYRKGPVDTVKMYSSPVDMRGSDFNSYGFSLLGFHFLAKVDRRPFPQVYGPFILNGSTTLRVPFIEFHETPQGRGAYEMLLAARARRSNYKRPGRR
jgi:hypothetical protein